jgi:hypothetical protein
MSQIHFGVMYDTDTGEFTQVALEEMPVDSKEYVFENDEWRRPKHWETNWAFQASQQLNELIRPALDNVRQV